MEVIFIFVKKIEAMSNAFFNVPTAINEPVKSYAPGSEEKTSLIETYKKMKNQDPIDIPMFIGGKESKNKKQTINIFSA